MPTTLLTPAPIKKVKRNNKLPLYIGGFVVLLLALAYIYALASHKKKEVLAAFGNQFSTTEPLVKPEPQEEVHKAPPAPPPTTPPPTTEKVVEDPWAKMELENKLKWAQMKWDHLFKSTEASFSRSEKLIDKRASEKQDALRASAAVDSNGNQNKDKGGLQNLASLFANRGGALDPAASLVNPSVANPMMGPSLTQQPGLQQASQVSTAYLIPPVSPYMLKQGTVIPLMLNQWLNSDAQGPWLATVSADVYDSMQSRHLLIPAGSTMFGFSDVAHDTNQQPVLMLAAQTLTLPNGSSLNLGRTFAQNGLGIQGLSGEVNRHLWQRYGSAALLSLMTAGIRIATYSRSGGFSYSPQDAAMNGAGSTMGEVVGEELRQSLRIRATATVKPGDTFTLMLVQDFAFNGPYQQENAQ